MSELGKSFFIDVLLTDDGLMIELMTLLMKMDQKNLSDLDFVQIIGLYLERVNFDPELFIGLLLECEGAKVCNFFDI